MFSGFPYPSSVVGSSSFFVRKLVSSSYYINLNVLQSYLTSIVVLYIMPYFVVVIVFQSFLLTFTLTLSFRSKTALTLSRPFLGNVYLYSVRVVTLITSGPAGYIIASSSTIVPSIAFLYTPLIEIVVDFNRYSNYSFQSRIVGSSTYKFILNVILQTSIVYSYQGIRILSYLLRILLKLSSILRSGSLLYKILDNSYYNLFIVTQSIDPTNNYNELYKVYKQSFRVYV